MKNWPALDFPLAADTDRILAAVDDFSPTAVEEGEAGLRIFFGSSEARAAAQAALTQGGFSLTSVDVSDEDWARRSQESLGAITVGGITVAPPWSRPPTADSRLPTADCRLPTVTIVIAPSMGFGTGHHATTRLCLAALQTINLSNRFVLDVGTGSGVLAIATVTLGAARALGIDNDPDAIHSATENLALNSQVHGIEFRVADLTSAALPAADVVTANLTGALLVRTADRLVKAVRPGGTLILSGLLAEEEEAVRAVFPSDVVRRSDEDGWVALVLSLHLKATRLV